MCISTGREAECRAPQVGMHVESGQERVTTQGRLWCERERRNSHLTPASRAVINESGNAGEDVGKGDVIGWWERRSMQPPCRGVWSVLKNKKWDCLMTQQFIQRNPKH